MGRGSSSTHVFWHVSLPAGSYLISYAGTESASGDVIAGEGQVSCRLFLVTHNYDLVAPVNNHSSFTSTDMAGHIITAGGEAYSKLTSSVGGISGFTGITISTPDVLQASCTVGPESVPATMENVSYNPNNYAGAIQTTAGQLVVLSVGSVDIQTP